MRIRAIACLAAAVLVASPVSSQIPVQTQPGAPVPGAPPLGPPRSGTAKTGTAILRGHVVAADSGQPLRKAQVRLSSATPTLGAVPTVRGTSTDKNGAFEFKEAAAGRYMLNADKGSYVALAWGQRRATDPGTPLEVLDGQTIEKLDFSLPRGAILTGRIIDEFGDAAPDVMVSASRTMVVSGQRRLIPAGRSSTTNDIGEFRIFGLPPGQYYLSATYRGVALNQESDDRSGYAPTYYPGSPNIGEAQRVTVALGQSIADLNLQLVATRTARISGIVLDSSGKPMSGSPIVVTQRSESFTGGLTTIAQLKPDGTFTLNGLAPGEYALQSLSSINNLGAGDSEVVMATVTVNGEDVNGVQLIGVRPSLITGRIVLPNAAAGGTFNASTVRLVATTKTQDFGPAPTGVGRVNDDLTFEIKSPPGTRVVAFQGPVPGWALKAVRVNGADVTDRGFEVKPAQDQSGFEIELTNQLTNVSGLVTNTRGEHATDYTVVFFSQDREKWQPPNRYFRAARPDQDGRFKLSGLPAGEYYTIATDSIDPNEASDPEVLERISSRATSFSLNDGETKALDLRLTTGL
jgi:5-hydroxyisourate hydrolase-like protein (transthyretin family)